MRDLVIKYFKLNYIIKDGGEKYIGLVAHELSQILGINNEEILKYIIEDELVEYYGYNKSIELPKILPVDYLQMECFKTNIENLINVLGDSDRFNIITDLDELKILMLNEYGYVLSPLMYSPYNFTPLNRWIRIFD